MKRLLVGITDPRFTALQPRLHIVQVLLAHGLHGRLLLMLEISSQG